MAEAKREDRRPKVRGVIDQAALARTPQLFDQSAATIASELLQNARRAGATKVSVTIEERAGTVYATFEDDGAGVSDFRNLVTFGRSGWDEGTAPVEAWAGMGVFVLASRGCRVDSLGSVVDLTPEVFIGRAEAPVRPAPFRHGTRIRFALPEKGDLQVRSRNGRGGTETGAAELSRELRSEALYCPILVTVDGEELPRLPFLEHAVEVVHVDGVDIGLYDMEAIAKRNPSHRQRRNMMRHNPRSAGNAVSHRSEDLAINFGGHAVALPERLVVDALHDHWTFLFDVRDGASIRLRLPTRDSVIENDAWHALRAAAGRSVWEAALRRGTHRLAMDEVREARIAGIPLPDPEVVLIDIRTYFRQLAAHARHLDEDSVIDDCRRLAETTISRDREIAVLDTAWSEAARCVLQGLLTASPRAPIIAFENSRLVGVSDYDALPRVVALEVRLHLEGGEKVTHKAFHRFGDHDELDADEYPKFYDAVANLSEGVTLLKRVEATLVISRAGHRKRRIGPVSVPILLSGGEWHGPEEIEAFVASDRADLDTAMAAADLAAILYDVESYDFSDEDTGPGVDGITWRAAPWVDEMRANISRVIKGDDGLDGVRAAFRVADTIARCLDFGETGEMDTVTLLVKPGRNGKPKVTVKIKDEDGVEVSATLDDLLKQVGTER